MCHFLSSSITTEISKIFKNQFDCLKTICSNDVLECKLCLGIYTVMPGYN